MCIKVYAHLDGVVPLVALISKWTGIEFFMPAEF